VVRLSHEQMAMETRRITGGERKIITTLFADFKGSTALIEGLDLEEARGREILRNCIDARS